jgi:Flp pilus assembly protein TadG
MNKSKQNSGQRFYRRRSGSQLVEFALVIPVLLVALFGICQYGFIFADYITLRNASAAAARQDMINSNNNHQLASALAKATVSPLLNPASVTFTPGITNLASGGNAQVITLTYPLRLIIPYIVPGATNGIRTLTATTVIR